MTSKTKDNQTLNALGNLIKLLPTGTVFTFRFLSPILSNNGHCHRGNKYLMVILLTLCGLSCGLSTFTDSHKDEEGNTHYGIPTLKGMWKPGSSSKKVDLAKHRLRMNDFVHALLGLLVFGVVAVLDSNTVNCFLPNWAGDSRQDVLMGLPIVVGMISSGVFAVFPSERNGIGYPSMVDSRNTVVNDNGDGSKLEVALAGSSHGVDPNRVASGNADGV